MTRLAPLALLCLLSSPGMAVQLTRPHVPLAEKITGLYAISIGYQAVGIVYADHNIILGCADNQDAIDHPEWFLCDYPRDLTK